MLASTTPRLVAQVQSRQPRVLDIVVGNVLELMIHAVEELREQLGQIQLR